MRIRVNKVMGYGLGDIVPNDIRLDKNGYLFPKHGNEFSSIGFVEMMSKKSYVHLVPTDMKFYQYVKIIDHIESENKKILIFTPPFIQNWARYDDIIDYYDPSSRSDDGGIKGILVKLSHPIYPYSGFFNIKKHPPVKLSEKENILYSTILYKNVITAGFFNKKFLEEKEYLEELWFMLGLDSLDELKTCIVPAFPQELVDMLKFLKIFTKEEYIYQIRPMICTYWEY